MSKKHVRFLNVSDSDSDSVSSEESAATRKKRLQKEYNKQYYAKNKKKILSTLLQKVPCPHCSKMVNHQNLKAHQRSNNCSVKEDLVKELRELKALINKNYFKPI